jgi:high-affinity nickel-transport protein
MIFLKIVLPNTLTLALVSAAVLGFRHGFDYDHIAAISDITSVEPSRRSAMRMGLIYVLGHAATVAVLGGAVIFFQRSLPARIDSFAERAVGLTLVLLGIYVLGTMLRDRQSFVPRSRASILIGSFRWLVHKTRSIFGAATTERPNDAPENYSNKSVFVIGVIHGLGAETPSQLLLFLLAANLGGIGRGFLGLAMFLAGLLVMNTIMTASAVGIFGASAARPRLMKIVIGLTAAYSLVVGSVFLFGLSTLLPPLGG